MTVTATDDWSPDYKKLGQSRFEINLLIESSSRDGIKKIYGDDPIRFVMDFCITYDPRRSGQKKIPFYLFEKQIEFILWLKESITINKGGVVLKSRDMGATWCCCAFSVWMWLFIDGCSVGWGSRKEILVDRLADPDSIFEKIRMILNQLPKRILPKGFNQDTHCNFMKIINPDNGCTITGEAGDNMGRGGRKTIYFKDESAHYERPELIEAALSENTDIQIDISSVNGVGNVFHRRATAENTRLFEMDWRDHPLKDDKWYEAKRQKALEEGLEHIFRQEVDRDFTAAVEGILIPGNIVQACIDAHIKLGVEPEGIRQLGFDPYDEGGDRHAFVSRHGILVNDCEEWGEGDTGEATRKIYSYCGLNKIDRMVYDATGVGAGVKAEIKRITSSNESDYKLDFDGFVAGGKVNMPELREYGDRKNKDMFFRLKAQESWRLRERFFKTYNAVVKGEPFKPEEIISLDSKMKYINKLVIQLSQPLRGVNDAGQIIIKKKPEGTKSPNLFDSMVQACCGKAYSIPKRGLRF